MKLTLSFLSSRFEIILRTKKGFDEKKKAFFIIIKWLPTAKNCPRPESAPLREARFVK